MQREHIKVNVLPRAESSHRRAPGKCGQRKYPVEGEFALLKDTSSKLSPSLMCLVFP